MLDTMIAASRARLPGLRDRAESLAASAASAPPPRDFAAALAAPGLGVIAEVKRRSPSAGSIAPDLDPRHLAAAYSDGGAAAVSVLTESDHFGGSLSDLEAVVDEVDLPALRKDFIIDPLQVAEARAAGASAVLLIVAVLDQDALVALATSARELGIAALVEVHDAEEMGRAIDAGAEVIGINNRDLATFEVDLENCLRLRPLVPDGVIAIAESGVTDSRDAATVRAAGFDAVLVGQAAAQAQDPAAFVASLVTS